jgi:hypothetical protein
MTREVFPWDCVKYWQLDIVFGQLRIQRKATLLSLLPLAIPSSKPRPNKKGQHEAHNEEHCRISYHVLTPTELALRIAPLLVVRTDGNDQVAAGVVCTSWFVPHPDKTSRASFPHSSKPRQRTRVARGPLTSWSSAHGLQTEYEYVTNTNGSFRPANLLWRAQSCPDTTVDTGW